MADDNFRFGDSVRHLRTGRIYKVLSVEQDGVIFCLDADRLLRGILTLEGLLVTEVAPIVRRSNVVKRATVQAN